MGLPRFMRRRRIYSVRFTTTAEPIFRVGGQYTHPGRRIGMYPNAHYEYDSGKLVSIKCRWFSGSYVFTTIDDDGNVIRTVKKAHYIDPASVTYFEK